MEIIYGIGGVLSLGLLAAFVTFDVRELFGKRSMTSWMDDDPNSTIGVTRAVLRDKGEPMRAAQLRTN